MLRYLPILIITAVAHAWCAAPVGATCGDYLHTAGEPGDDDRVEPSTVDPASFTEPGHGNSCEHAPDCPTPPQAPVSLPTVIDAAVLSATTPLLALDGRRRRCHGDERAAHELMRRIDRPPRAAGS